jgi:peptidylprolyl isomerase
MHPVTKSVRRALPSISLILLAMAFSAHSLSAAPVTPATTPTHKKPAPTTTPLPKNIPPVAAPVKVQFVMRFQEIKVGTGALAAPGQIYTVHYTGWLASDGTKFDSSYDRNKPFDFQQGTKRVIIGWDQGFEGMHVGGKRRLFIPYQLAYGEAGRGPIPPKANLIFDIELVDMHDPNAQMLQATPPAQ